MCAGPHCAVHMAHRIGLSRSRVWRLGHLVVGPAPEERLEPGLRAQKPCLGVGVPERVDLADQHTHTPRPPVTCDRGTFCETAGLGNEGGRVLCKLGVCVCACVCVGAGAEVARACQVPRGMALSPKFFLRNWCPRVVWSIISV